MHHTVSVKMTIKLQNIFQNTQIIKHAKTKHFLNLIPNYCRKIITVEIQIQIVDCQNEGVSDQQNRIMMN